MRKLFLGLGVFAVLMGVAGYIFGFRPLRNGHPPDYMASGMLAVSGATIYYSPDAPPVEGGTILMSNGRIVALGAQLPVPSGAQVIPCNHCVVTAGFWNAHVHFTERKWANSDWQPAAKLNAQLADMLTSRGFTTIVDVGSNLRDTIPIRRRIEAGELLGPKIYTAGSAIYPPNGIPYYLKDTLPWWLLKLLPEPATPVAAARVETRNITDGADVLKLFTGSLTGGSTVLPMPVDNARAAVEVAHRHGQLAFAHPSSLAGAQVAIDSGVDVLAHAPSEAEGVDARFLQSIVNRHMAMVPTLKMFGTTVTKRASFLDPIYAEVRQFHAAGGQLIFGTDVGYMTDYTTDDEFAALAQSGLTAMDILRMLTTAPAARFNVAQEKGTIAPGKLADLVILDGDPAKDVQSFARVNTTVRSGRVIYQR